MNQPAEGVNQPDHRVGLHRSSYAHSGLVRVRGPTLIVTPPTILGQWEAEFKRHSDLKVRVGGVSFARLINPPPLFVWGLGFPCRSP